MLKSVYELTLDIHDSASKECLVAKKGDTARELHISLSEDGIPYSITEDCTAVFTALKPDGTIIYNGCTIEGNEITYPFTLQTTAAIGRLECEVRLLGDDAALLTSASFDIVIEDTVYDNDTIIESSSEALAFGVSPYIKVTEIDGGHRVTITDAYGTNTFDVMDGTGAPGSYTLPVATAERLGGVKVGDNLTITDSGVLSVDVANDATEDDTRPITSAAVHMEIGNIDALLSII